jgi:hypothetical protein
MNVCTPFIAESPDMNMLSVSVSITTPCPVSFPQALHDDNSSIAAIAVNRRIFLISVIF